MAVLVAMVLAPVLLTGVVYALGGLLELVRQLIPRRAAAGPEPWWIGVLVGLGIWASICATLYWFLRSRP